MSGRRPRAASAFDNPTEEEKRYLGELAHWIARRDRLPMDPGHPPADAGLRPDAIRRPASRPGSWRNSAPGRIAVAMSRARSAATACSPTSRFIGLPARSGRRSGRITRAFTARRFCPPARPSRCPPATRNSRAKSSGRRAAPAERVFTDIRRWTVMPKGGHFAALEQPEPLAHEVRAFFRELR